MVVLLLFFGGVIMVVLTVVMVAAVGLAVTLITKRLFVGHLNKCEIY